MSAPDRVQGIAARLRDRGLRPVIEADLAMVVCDCPGCRAQDCDPLGIWRPLRVVPRGRVTTILCKACGREKVHGA